jgi:hypothetical protein
MLDLDKVDIKNNHINIQKLKDAKGKYLFKFIFNKFDLFKEYETDHVHIHDKIFNTIHIDKVIFDFKYEKYIESLTDNEYTQLCIRTIHKDTSLLDASCGTKLYCDQIKELFFDKLLSDLLCYIGLVDIYILNKYIIYYYLCDFFNIEINKEVEERYHKHIEILFNIYIKTLAKNCYSDQYFSDNILYLKRCNKI